MIDLKLLQADTEAVAEKLASKNFPKQSTYELYDLVKQRNLVQAKKEDIVSQKNKISKKIGLLYAAGEDDQSKIEALKAETNQLSDDIDLLQKEYNEIDSKFEYLYLRTPNLPNALAPIGNSESENVLIKSVNYDPNNYTGKNFLPHWELSEKYNLLDLQTASKLSGSMFAIYRGLGAKLLRALIQYGLDLNSGKYEEIVTPHFISTQSFTAAGQLPKFADDAYKIEDEDLWAIPTAETALMNLGRDKVYNYDELPKRFMAYTSCFRKEAGSYGKDTRGVQRLHEFHKVELVKYTTEEQAYEEFKELVSDSENAIKLLGLPYRIISLCTGDLTFASALTYDIEVYSPALDKWLEVSSISICTDFQSRRANMKYKDKDGKTKFVFGLNGSGIATPRVWATIIENYQQPDGSIKIPDVLQKYLGFEIIK